jgi:phage gp45-like
MTSMVELIRAVVRRELAAVRPPALGVVTGVHPHSGDSDDFNDEVDVRLQHEGLTLARVPVAVAQPGTVAPLKNGDLVLVQFLGGSLAQPLVTACFHHADDRPPLHAEGDLVIEHRVPGDDTRNQLRFTADGTIRIDRDLAANGTAKATVVLTKDGDVEVTCRTLRVTGDVVVDDGDLTVSNGIFRTSKGGTTEISGITITGKPGEPSA